MGGAGRVAALGLIIIMIGGLYMGSAAYALTAPSNEAGPASHAQPYDLTLIITDGNWYNGSTSFQSSYFLLQNGSIASSSLIRIPADTEIVITIVNYDNGVDNLSQQMYSDALGVANQSVFVTGVGNLTMNALQKPSQIQSDLSGVYLSEFPPNDISHTFTLISGNTFVNIPVEPHSVEQTSFALPPGSYIWQCECACGSAPNGWGGAMAADAWMSGVVIVG